MRLVPADVPTRVLLVLALVLLLAHFFGRLAARWRQPEVLGEVTAGLLLGPSLVGRVVPGLSAWLFPPAVIGIVQVLGQVGVALYAFEVGAGMVGPGPRPAGEGRGRVLPLAVSSAVLPALVGVAIAPWLYDRHLAGASVDLAAFAVYMGCVVGVTAVPVLARVLQDRHLEGTRTGALSIAAATVGDGFCWCLLALGLWLAGRTSSAALLLALLGAAAGALIGVWRRARGERQEPPGQVADRSAGAGGSGAPVLLAGVMTAAAASAWLGLHALLGGVLAGRIWAGGRTQGEAAAPAQLTSLARFFLPCFFLGAGLQVDLSAVADPGLLALVAMLVAIGLASKFAACLALRRYYRMSWREVHRLGVLMSTKGMTELVVLAAGRQAGLLSPRLFVVLVAAALVLTLCTGPWLRALEPKERLRPARDEESAAIPAPRP